MIRRRLWALTLMAVMTAGTLAGCGQTEDAKTPASKQEQQQEKESEKESAKEELKTIRCMGIDWPFADASGATVYFSDWLEDPDNKMWGKVESDLAERGIQLEFDMIPQDQYATTIQTRIVSGLDDYDWVWLSDVVDQNTINELIESGKILPVNEVIALGDGTAAEYYASGTGADLIKGTQKEDGSFYIVYGGSNAVYRGRNAGCPVGLHIRQDWLDKLGLPLPQTTEELYETLLAFQENDMNGNGMKDEVARISPLDGWENGIAQAFGLGVGYRVNNVCFDIANEKHVSPFYQDHAKEYFAYMNKLYTEGLLDTSPDDSSEVAENKAGALNEYCILAIHEPATVVPEGEKGAQYVWITPKAEGVEKVSISSGIGAARSADGVCIPANADTEAVAVLLDYISTDEFNDFSFYGMEGYTYNLVDGKKVKLSASDISEVQVMINYFATWCKVLPSVQAADYEDSFLPAINAGKDLGYEEGFTEKGEALYRIYDNLDNYAEYVGQQIMLNEEELARIDEIKPDLSTYMKEMAMNLITGDWSLDDWDEYMAELKKLGLDEMLEIYDANYERVLKIK